MNANLRQILVVSVSVSEPGSLIESLRRPLEGTGVSMSSTFESKRRMRKQHFRSLNFMSSQLLSTTLFGAPFNSQDMVTVATSAILVSLSGRSARDTARSEGRPAPPHYFYLAEIRPLWRALSPPRTSRAPGSAAQDMLRCQIRVLRTATPRSCLAVEATTQTRRISQLRSTLEREMLVLHPGLTTPRTWRQLR